MNMSDIPEMSPYLRLKVAQEVFKKAPSSLSPEEKAEVEHKIKAAQMVLAAKENGEIN